MNEFFNEITTTGLLTGSTFAVIGYFMYSYPPAEINGLMGYRTKRSMKSQERWDFAQKYSSLRMAWGGVALIAFSLVTYFIPVDQGTKEIIGVAAMLILALYMIAATEIQLKKRFKD